MLEHVLGRHLICELRDCNFDTINNTEFIISTLVEGCRIGHAGIIGHIEHKFTPTGVTVLVLLSESHCSCHTWPEKGYVMLDVCTCGNHVDGSVIFNYIHSKLGGRMKMEQMDRGIPFLEDTVGLVEPL